MDDQTDMSGSLAGLPRLQAHPDGDAQEVQTFDMMNRRGFWPTCLSRWFRRRRNCAGIEMTPGEAREGVYGMTMAGGKKVSRGTAVRKRLVTQKHVGARFGD